MITSAHAGEVHVHSVGFDAIKQDHHSALSAYSETVELISNSEEKLSDCNASDSCSESLGATDSKNSPSESIGNISTMPVANESLSYELANLQSTAPQWNSNYNSGIFDDGFSLDEFVFGQNSNVDQWRDSLQTNANYSQQNDKILQPGTYTMLDKPYPTNTQVFDTRNQNFLDLINVNDEQQIIEEQPASNYPRHRSNESAERKRDYSLSSDSGVGCSLIWDTSPSPTDQNISMLNTSPQNKTRGYGGPKESQPILSEQDVQTTRYFSPESSVADDDCSDDNNITPTVVLTEKMSKKTAYNEKWGVKVLKAWCNENNIKTKFENLTVEELNGLLTRFWAEVRKSNGDYYGRNSLFNLRAMINKHMKGHPYNVEYDIVTDDRFRTSNEMLEKQLKVLKGIGKTITHKQPISISDLRLMYDSKVLGMHNPHALLRKVWFEITLHFGHKGSESQEKLMNNTFRIFRDASSRAYVARAKPGNSDADEIRMYETGGELCPVQSYQKYLSKLHPLQPRLFQQPRRKSTPSSPMWYGKAPIGEKALQQMMANISVSAKLSKRYTNHCVRTTALEQFCDSRRKGKSKSSSYYPQSQQQILPNQQQAYQQRPNPAQYEQPIHVNNHYRNPTPMGKRLPSLSQQLPNLSPVRSTPEMYYGKRPSQEEQYSQMSPEYYLCQNEAKRPRYDPQYHSTYVSNAGAPTTTYSYDNLHHASVKCEEGLGANSTYLSDTVMAGHHGATSTVITTMYPQT